ncbi:hypothetical protein ACTVKF_18520 [Serratia marcescens]|uniref:hypothetical protein n=1 Tax=Serratia TaxID=613 RepID=UPI00111AE459|nr:hypothetical protein [Serratia marcescens]MDX6807920.1 hypothetical protein [Serratia marcescens]HBC7448613.1 hypothetical protein [Serratia marcescens]
MTNKLSELSKPVAWKLHHHDRYYFEENADVVAIAESMGQAKGDAVYSQEYVSALIDENSAAKIAGVKEFAAEMIASADDSDNSLPDDVRDGMRRAAAFANMFIDLRGVQHG